MEKSKFLVIVIICLLLLNFGTLAFMWMHKPGPGHDHREHGPQAAMFLERELNLNEDQKNKYKVLREDHHEKIRNIQEEIHNLRDEFFNQLSLTDTLKYNSIAIEIGEKQKQIELITFEHFKKVREVCNEDQKKKFDHVIMDALRMMAPPPLGEGPPPR